MTPSFLADPLVASQFDQPPSVPLSAVPPVGQAASFEGLTEAERDEAARLFRELRGACVMASKRTRGYKPWNPQEKTKAVLADIHQVLEDYRPRWPLTIRQVYYVLVAVHGYKKSPSFAEKVGEYINKARREPRDVWWKIPWEAITDEGAVSLRYGGYRDERTFWLVVRSVAERFKLDLLQFQDTHVIVVCEARGMAPQLAAVAHEYGVDVLSGGGFDSTTSKHALAKEVAEIGKPVKLLHFTDLDPSGKHISTNLDEDVFEFITFYGGDVELIRLAVTSDQQAEYDLPTAPVNENDDRSFEHDWTVQCEALDPDTLADIVRAGIEEWTDLAVLKKAKAKEKRIRRKITKRLEGLQ